MSLDRCTHFDIFLPSTFSTILKLKSKATFTTSIEFREITRTRPFLNDAFGVILGLPVCLPTYIPTYLPTYLPTYIPT